jgi:hypothetical protein
MIFIVQFIRKFILNQAVALCLSICLGLVTSLTSSTTNTCKPTLSGYWQETQCLQISALNQNFYERSATLDKPDLLKGQTGLCGIFATYNGYCMLQALDNPNNRDYYLSQMKSVDAFHEWVKENESMVKKIKNRHKRVGNLNNIPLQTLTAGLSHDQIDRIIAFDYYFIEEKKPTSGQPVGITAKLESFGLQIKNFACSFICKRFAKQFQNSSKPHIVIFNLEDHWITIALSATHTFVADSCNINRLSDYRVIALDTFMRNRQSYTKDILNTLGLDQVEPIRTLAAAAA